MVPDTEQHKLTKYHRLVDMQNRRLCLPSSLSPGRAQSSNAVFDIQSAVATIYGGDVETMSLDICQSSQAEKFTLVRPGHCCHLFLAMVLNPECQIKAQEETDAVIGSSQLPGFEDREALPYVECVLQETLRYWLIHFLFRTDLDGPLPGGNMLSLSVCVRVSGWMHYVAQSHGTWPYFRLHGPWECVRLHALFCQVELGGYVFPSPMVLYT